MRISAKRATHRRRDAPAKTLRFLLGTAAALHMLMSETPWLETKVREQEERIKTKVHDLAMQLGICSGVQFTGDPRGYTVRLMLRSGRYNTWGGAESGYGIA